MSVNQWYSTDQVPNKKQWVKTKCKTYNNSLLISIYSFLGVDKITKTKTQNSLIILGFSLNRAELSLNSANSANLENPRNHWSTNWVQCRDLLCYICLCGTVVSSLSLTQEVKGLNIAILFFRHWIQWIQWKHLGKTPLDLSLVLWFVLTRMHTSKKCVVLFLRKSGKRNIRAVHLEWIILSLIPI